MGGTFLRKAGGTAIGGHHRRRRLGCIGAHRLSRGWSAENARRAATRFRASRPAARARRLRRAVHRGNLALGNSHPCVRTGFLGSKSLGQVLIETCEGLLVFVTVHTHRWSADRDGPEPRKSRCRHPEHAAAPNRALHRKTIGIDFAASSPRLEWNSRRIHSSQE